MEIGSLWGAQGGGEHISTPIPPSFLLPSLKSYFLDKTDMFAAHVCIVQLTEAHHVIWTELIIKTLSFTFLLFSLKVSAEKWHQYLRHWRGCRLYNCPTGNRLGPGSLSVQYHLSHSKMTSLSTETSDILKVITIPPQVEAEQTNNATDVC